MPLEISGKGGKTRPFDQARFGRWLARNYQIPPEAGFKIARATRQLLVAEGHDSVPARTLPIRASGLMAQALMGTFPGKGVRKFELIGDLDPTGLIPDPADVVAALLSILKWLIGQFGDQGWEQDRPGYLKREIVGFIPPFDDQKAPEVRNFKVTGYDCCKTGDQRGVEVTMTVEVTDTGGIGNSSGVRSVEICGVHVAADGNWFMGPCHTVDLDEDAQERSEDGWETVTVKMCFDCAYAKLGVLPIVINATDRDDNGRMCLTTIPFGPDIQKQCCGEQ